jgi:hypothetical protein
MQWTRCSKWLVAGVALSLFAVPSVSKAQLFTLDTNIGTDPVKVNALLTELANGVQFTLSIAGDSPNIGDFRGFFFNFADESLLAGASVTGADITDSVFDANNVTNLGGGNNINPAAGFDAGVEIGDSGIGMGDDIQSTIFVVTHNSVNLNVTDFYATQADGYGFGARLTSVGVGDDREGSSKVVMDEPFPPIPEPAFYQMSGLLLMGGAGIFLRARRSRKNAG